MQVQSLVPQPTAASSMHLTVALWSSKPIMLIRWGNIPSHLCGIWSASGRPGQPLTPCCTPSLLHRLQYIRIIVLYVSSQLQFCGASDRCIFQDFGFQFLLGSTCSSAHGLYSGYRCGHPRPKNTSTSMSLRFATLHPVSPRHLVQVVAWVRVVSVSEVLRLLFVLSAYPPHPLRLAIPS